MEENNYIELNIGDEFRQNKARTNHRVVEKFTFCEKEYIVTCKLPIRKCGDTEYPELDLHQSKYLGGVYILYGNVWDGIVELNGQVIRGKAGKLLDTPKPIKEKVKKEVKKVNEKPLTDFQKFYKLQCSGKINMTDYVRGAILTGLTEDKYLDILWNYNAYKTGEKQ